MASLVLQIIFAAYIATGVLLVSRNVPWRMIKADWSSGARFSRLAIFVALTQLLFRGVFLWVFDLVWLSLAEDDPEDSETHARFDDTPMPKATIFKISLKADEDGNIIGHEIEEESAMSEAMTAHLRAQSRGKKES